MSAHEQDSTDDSKAVNDALHGMRELILSAICVESKALRMELRQMQKDILRILSKLPGDGSDTERPEPRGAGGCLAAARSAKRHASRGTAAAGKPASLASPRVSSASAVTEASPQAELSKAASPQSRVRDPAGSKESTPRIEVDQAEDQLEPRRSVSGEFHVEAQPPSTCLGRPSSTAWTYRRYQAARPAAPKASRDVPQQAQRGISHRSIVPAVAQDFEDFDGIPFLKTSPGKEQSRSRFGTILGKSANASQPPPDCSGPRTFPSEVSTAACSFEAAQTKHVGLESLESFHELREGMEEDRRTPSQEEPEEGAAGAPPDDAAASGAAGPAGERCGGSIEGGLARLCGMLPWSVTWKWSTWLYQQLLAVVATLVAVGLTGGLVAEIVDGEVNLATILEALLAVGSSLGLWSCQVHRSSKKLVHAQEVLGDWMSSNGVQVEIGQAHVVLSLLMWVAAVGAHLGATAADGRSAPVLRRVGFAVASLLHTALVSMLVHTCNCITVILDVFSDSVVLSKDFPRAVYEWHCVRACCQSVCRAVEACFVVMVTFAATGVLMIVLRLSSKDVSLTMVPALLLTLVSFRILFYAAVVTEKCAHVPILVNSVGMEKTLDPTRMYAVQYMRYCQSGFYIFGTRITPSGVLKAAYIGCAVAFAILTQHNQDSPFAQ